jgi:hypothetical protein
MPHDLIRKLVPIPDQVEDSFSGSCGSVPAWIRRSINLTGFSSQKTGVTVMRFLMIAVTATILLLPAAAPANACGAAKHSAQAASIEISAETKKPMKKKTAKVKQPKVEYMRAAPM